MRALKAFAVQGIVIGVAILLLAWVIIMATPTEYPHINYIGDYKFDYRVYRPDYQDTIQTIHPYECYISVLTDQVNIDGMRWSLAKLSSHDEEDYNGQKLETMVFLDPRDNLVSLHILEGRLKAVSILIIETREFYTFESNFNNTLKEI